MAVADQQDVGVDGRDDGGGQAGREHEHRCKGQAEVGFERTWSLP